MIVLIFGKRELDQNCYIDFVKNCQNSLLLKNEKSKNLRVYYVFKWIMCLSRFHSFNTIRILGQKIRCTYCCINYAPGLPTSKNSWNKIVISFNSSANSVNVAQVHIGYQRMLQNSKSILTLMFLDNTLSEMLSKRH